MNLFQISSLRGLLKNSRRPTDDGRNRSTGGQLRLFLAAVVLVWLASSWSALTGERTFVLRDLFSNHLPLQQFGAAALEVGELPALNPHRGLGQPFRGNPAAAAFYPGNLIYRLLPVWVAFSAHFVLHWLLAVGTLRTLARELGVSRLGSWVAAVTYAGSGWFLSTFTFYNLIAPAAWWPLAIWAALRGGRRGCAIGGLACGLALLGGEPVSIAIGSLASLVVVASRHGWLRSPLLHLPIWGLGVCVAAPQWVATLRILGSSLRGSGMAAEASGRFQFVWIRLLELLVPFPFGLPFGGGSDGIWATGWLPEAPFFLTIFFGSVGLWLAFAGLRAEPLWGGLAAAGLVLAALPSKALLLWLSGGLLRYPEKFLLLFALATALLVGAGFDRVTSASRLGRTAWVWAAALASVAVLLWFSGGMVDTESGRVAVRMSSALTRAARDLGLAALLVSAGAFFVVRGAPLGVALAQLVALLPLAPIWVTDPVTSLTERPAWFEALEDRRSIVRTDLLVPPWARPGLDDRSRADRLMTDALITGFDWRQRSVAGLAPVSGVGLGFEYPLEPDPEGLGSRDYTVLLVALAGADEALRAAWLRLLGVELIVSAAGTPVGVAAGALQPVADDGYWHVSALREPEPEAWFAQTVELYDDSLMPFRSRRAPAAPTAWVRREHAALVEKLPQEKPSRTVSTVMAVQTGSDQWQIDVEGEGGLLIVQRAFQPLWTAYSAVGDSPARPLDVLPVYGVLTGIVVPAGKLTVELTVSSRPERLAAAFSGFATLALLCVALWPGFWGRDAYRGG